jgi:DNA-binding NtrC family response regulator
MQKDISDLKKKIAELTNSKTTNILEQKPLILDGASKENVLISNPYPNGSIEIAEYIDEQDVNLDKDIAVATETLSIPEKEKELIKKALLKNKGRRKKAAVDLCISERTLYRKLKEYNLEEWRG